MIGRDRTDRIEALFSAVYDLGPEERNAALLGVAAVDRAEVERLIEAHDALITDGDAFLGVLDTYRARSLLERSGPPREVPRAIGRYTVVRCLACGGMGIVYLARDPRLERLVAIKVLPPFLSADPVAVGDLAREARMASALDDPRIETVYEIGETDEGEVFIAMAYYDGETLRERISRGPMAVSDTIELGIQLAEGLETAHRAGIIHGDVKPENILITGSGALKIVDFGVAKMLREGSTTAGLLQGTAAYMSPEQTQGERLDGRADLWSTGVVLQEMLAGQRPFRGEGASLVHGIRHDAPPDLGALRDDLPPGLAGLVARCLAKEPACRPGSAGILATELRAVGKAETLPASPAPALRDRPRRRGVLASIGAASLAVLVFATVLVRQGRDAGPIADANVAPAIAVLPFEVRGEGLDIWREGMIDLLSIVLGGTTELRTVDARTVLARWRESVGETQPDLDGALAVARATGARYAVLGSIVSVAQGLRLSARIHALPAGSELTSLQVQGPADSLFSLVDRLAIDILDATWQGEEQPQRPIDLTRNTTSSLPALKAFLQGESLLRQADFAGAVADYERAVAEDSTFAFALFHLGLAYGWVGDAARQDGSYERALRQAARLPEPEVGLLRALLATASTDLATAIGMLSEVARSYPDNPEAWYFLGDRYFHDGRQVLASREESERAFRRVVALDPVFAPAYIHLVHNAFSYRPDGARADSLMKIYRGLVGANTSTREQQLAFGLAFGDSTRRKEAYVAIDTLPVVITQQVVAVYLDHPRFWATRQTVLERLRRRQSPIDELQYRMTTIGLLNNAVSLGRLRAALALLDDPTLAAGIRAGGTYWVYAAAPGLFPSTFESAFAVPGEEDLQTGMYFVMSWFYSGAYAADRGRWGDHASAVERLLAEADRLQGRGDSASARFVRGAATALAGKGLWARGDVDEALPLLREGQRMATWPATYNREVVNESIRWWIGELLLQAGRPRDAAPYFEASWNNPLAAERLGPIYERLGDPSRARAAYDLVVAAWQEADPELQARARTAKAASRRLDGSRAD